MSGNPYFGKTNIQAYRDACTALANGTCVQRMNELHLVGRDYGVQKAEGSADADG